jgi:hypothetical protein
MIVAEKREIGAKVRFGSLAVFEGYAHGFSLDYS